MKMLAVFLLAVLGWSLAEGKHVSKCELRDQLKGAINKPLMREKMKVSDVDDLVAKCKCCLLMLRDEHGGLWLMKKFMYATCITSYLCFQLLVLQSCPVFCLLLVTVLLSWLQVWTKQFELIVSLFFFSCL